MGGIVDVIRKANGLDADSPMPTRIFVARHGEAAYESSCAATTVAA